MNQPIPDPNTLKEALELHKTQAGRWRRLWVATFVAYFLTIVFIAWGTLEWQENNDKRDEQITDLRAIAEDIDVATSPEAQARQQEQIAQILVQVDCNQRDALQDVIDGLRNNGILEHPITVITPECL